MERSWCCLFPVRRQQPYGIRSVWLGSQLTKKLSCQKQLQRQQPACQFQSRNSNSYFSCYGNWPHCFLKNSLFQQILVILGLLSEWCRHSDGGARRRKARDERRPHRDRLPWGPAGKESACHAGHLGLIPGWEDPLEKRKATHSRIWAWRIPWTV